MKNISACLSHKSDNWKTPTPLYDLFINKYKFEDLFPYCSKLDQYEIIYSNKWLFCNPPYSQMNKVCDYIINLIYNDNVIFLLVPVRTDTKWFDKLFYYCHDIIFFKGRLKFNDSSGAPFPSMLMVFGLKDLESPYHLHIETLEECINHLTVVFDINK